MSRVTAQAEVNGFEGGLSTDSNPLSQTPNTTSDEVNMDLNTDKSRSRRLGFDTEQGFVDIDSGVPMQSSLGILGNSTFNWKNAGGDINKELLVVQFGGNIKVFDLDNTPVTSEVIYSEDFLVGYENVFSYAVVDGILVISTGLKYISTYQYSSGVITKTDATLLIRDLFGVEVTLDGVVITDTLNFQVRPVTINESHVYNLRNSTFSGAHFVGNDEVLKDPITAFSTTVTVTSDPFGLGTFGLSSSSSTTKFAGVYPSNADNLLDHLYADATDAGDRNSMRFWPEAMRKSSPVSSNAPTGFHIIDALDRGSSRLDQSKFLRDNNPVLEWPITSLPLDKTPDGASVVAEHSGRVWYGGFSAKVIDGDSRSPRMSSYVLFSKLVKDVSDITRCYQEADPTSPVDNAVVDTDGGFIRIDGAYGIKAMVSLSSSILVFAKNGVWSISGGDGVGFKATDYVVKKITSNGVDSAKSVVVVDNTILYWGEESIYVIDTDKVTSEHSSKDMTTTRIKSFYLDIPLETRKTCSGYFDKYSRRVVWVYSNMLGDGESSQLVFNIDHNSFTPQTVKAYSDNLPKIVDIVESQPYQSGESVTSVTSLGTAVVSGGVEVVSSVGTRASTATREALYIVVKEVSPTVVYSVGTFTDPTFLDWASLGGVDSGAYMTVNSVTGGTGRFRKEVPYLTTFFKQTETGLNDDGTLINPSSCFVSSRWGWTDNQNSNKWSVPRQAYRISRPYTTVVGDFEDGQSVLTTRNKIRGSGKSIAFHLEGEVGKNLHIYGWSFNLNRTTKE